MAAHVGDQMEPNQLEEATAGAAPPPHPASAADTGLNWRNWVSLGAFVVNLIFSFLLEPGAIGESNTDQSRKYQTLVTPTGFAFAIWGLIFLWEGIWTIVQMMPRYNQSAPVKAAAPWWWATCLFQVAWTLAFAQDSVPLSLCLMLCILASLLGVVLSLDQQKLSLVQYLLLRAPFALHLGWIIAASNVNLNVVADWDEASPSVLLGLGIASLAAVVAVATFFACGVKTPEPIVCLVAAWALFGIGRELEDPVNLNAPLRYNPYVWNDETVEGVKYAAYIAAAATLLLTLISVAVVALRAVRSKQPTPQGE